MQVEDMGTSSRHCGTSSSVRWPGNKYVRKRSKISVDQWAHTYRHQDGTGCGVT